MKKHITNYAGLTSKRFKFNYEAARLAFIKQYNRRISKGWSPVSTAPSSAEYKALYKRHLPESRAFRDLGMNVSPNDLILRQYFGERHDWDATQHRLEGLKRGLETGAWRKHIDEYNEYQLNAIDSILNWSGGVGYSNYGEAVDLIMSLTLFIPNYSSIVSPKEEEI